jgi:predicted RNA binding protein YcfA (HicA-like mRNA interferase family)
MPKIPPCGRAELIRKLKKLGFDGPYAGGRHAYMKRDKYRLTVPNPHGGQIDSGLIKEILRQTGVSEQDWLNA